MRTSNAGQCLLSERAPRVAKSLPGPDLFSGWGIRTVAATEARYNPMGYHNGGVWPHDNALIARGFAGYGMADEAARVFTGMFDAAMYFDLHRVPELFCGFPRDEGEGCSPMLPPFLNEARIFNLQVAGASVDLSLVRRGQDISVNVLRRQGDVDIVVAM